jgi:hypothetical protein
MDSYYIHIITIRTLKSNCKAIFLNREAIAQQLKFTKFESGTDPDPRIPNPELRIRIKILYGHFCGH